MINNQRKKVSLKNNAEKNKEAIIRDYENGMSLKGISRKYKSQLPSIKNMLNKNGIKLKSNVQYRKYPINEAFFEEIDTEEKAYILGFLYADGYMSFNNKSYNINSITLSLVETDRDILLKMAEAMGYIGYSPLYIPPQENRYSAKSQYRLVVRSKKMCEDLAKLGFKNNRDTIPDIEPCLLHHFIRGYFDGDGCISMSKNRRDVDMHIMGSEPFLRQVCDIFTENNILWNKPFYVKNIYRIRKSGRLNAIKLMDYMYKDANIYLQRKFDKFAALSQALQKTQGN